MANKFNVKLFDDHSM